jgi:hypothetical protein
MTDLIWRLPGVEAFIETVLRDIVGGSSVILHLPPSAPQGVVAAVDAHSFEDYRYMRWHNVTIQSNHSQLADLAQLVGHSVGVDTAFSAECLARQPAERIYAIEGVNEVNWPVLEVFLERFRQANHQRDETDRDVFLVSLPSQLRAPKVDIGLQVRRWEGITDEIDVRLFLEVADRSITHTSFSERVLQAVRRAIAIELAGTDLELARQLIEFELGDLIEPSELLLRYARSTTWCRADLDAWHDGGRDRFRAADHVHSAVLAFSGRGDELTRRVWRGQLTVLFPYLEERRLDILPRLGPHLFPAQASIRGPSGAGRIARAGDRRQAGGPSDSLRLCLRLRPTAGQTPGWRPWQTPPQ